MTTIISAKCFSNFKDATGLTETRKATFFSFRLLLHPMFALRLTASRVSAATCARALSVTAVAKYAECRFIWVARVCTAANAYLVSLGRYKTPLRDMNFVLKEVLNAESHYKKLGREDVSDLWDINESCAKFAEEVLLPLNASGDKEGCTYNLADNSVKTPKGFKEAYKSYSEAGYSAMTVPEAYGGQGSVSNAFHCMWYTTCSCSCSCLCLCVCHHS